MCGIAGIVAFSETANPILAHIEQATNTLRRRGPDNQSVYRHKRVALGHARLSIIDTSPTANQPLFDLSGQYAIVFNGEIFNYQELKKQLIAEGVVFCTESDTEVLLNGYIHWGKLVLPKLNGFFAFAIYHLPTETLFLARDRYGIKPLLWHADAQKLVFGSEIKALLACQIPRVLDTTSLYAYLQLNYVPPPHTMLEGVKHLPPGYSLQINIESGSIVQEQYYKIPLLLPAEMPGLSYLQAQQQLLQLMDNSVQLRLIADVPLGAFLSGGIDSSVIVALASGHTKHLNTFSIGFKDEPMFNETHYARLVAHKYKTNHTEFLLTTDDLLQHLTDTLDYIDEPFADSSALAVNLLSRLTRQQVKVALSGDGADELFAGYRKHAAELKAQRLGWAARLGSKFSILLQHLPQSRNTKTGNFYRQVNRFFQGANLPAPERYWRWASILPTNEAAQLLASPPNNLKFAARCTQWLQPLKPYTHFNQTLYADMQLVLPGDMLRKVDSMSMAHGLEVRTPFLDYRVVNFAFSLPHSYKINGNMKKRIVQDAFRHLLPKELYKRPKQGFEVPMLKWLKTDLKHWLEQDLLHPDRLKEQGIFNAQSVWRLLKQLQSGNPADSAATVWALLVFQYWWKKYFV